MQLDWASVILIVLLAISEALGLTTKVEANGIIDAILNVIKATKLIADHAANQ